MSPASQAHRLARRAQATLSSGQTGPTQTAGRSRPGRRRARRCGGPPPQEAGRDADADGPAGQGLFRKDPHDRR
jgi:hypothetical protein